MNILHIDSSILGGHSVSRDLSARLVAQLTDGSPDVGVAYRDIGADPVPHLTGAILAAGQAGGEQHSPEVAKDLAIGATLLAEFKAADTVVIGVPLYNFTVPSSLKAWIDRILIAGETFRYGPDGQPIGLASEKRVILAIARGGYYGPGGASAAFEHGESYLRSAFAFIGINNVETVVAEGLAIGPEARAAGIATATAEIVALAA